jgi:hypothetical protein
MTPYIPREKVCIQRPKGVKDEMFHMYFVDLKELGVRIPLTPSNFKKDLRETFVRVQGVKGRVEATVKVDGELRFPLCWLSAPVVVMGFDFDNDALRARHGRLLGEDVAYGYP